MEPITIKEICDIVKGKLIQGNPNAVACGVSVDSRTLKKRDIFIPLKSVRDGHSFIKDAQEKEASGALISKITDFKIPSQFPLIKVTNTLGSLGKMAENYRSKFNCKVAAVTGSSGKTTTKEMIACTLISKYNILKNHGNLNNEIGIPLTIFQLSKSHEICVFELGINHFGEMERLASMTKPNIAVLTNIGPVHLEFLKNLEGVARAKGELFELLTSDDFAVINFDDENAKKVIRRTRARVISFGINKKYDVSAEKIEQETNGKTRFILKIENKKTPIELQLIGRHQVHNALAAAATAWLLGISISDIKNKIETFELNVKGRLNIVQHKGITIVDDSYNANPSSVKAGLEAVRSMAGKGRFIAVLADMLELGEVSDKEHIAVGELVSQLNYDFLITVGEYMKHAAETARKNHMGKKAISCENIKQAHAVLKNILKKDDVVLIKGSHAMHMETLVDKLIGKDK